MVRRVAAFVSVLALFSCAAAPARADDEFVDIEGKRVEFSRVYRGWFGDDRFPPRYARAAAANGVILVLELFIYWYEPHSSIADWQYPSLREKLADPIARFDDNLPRTNMLLHPMAGGAHYGISRVNGLGIPASFAAAALSSALYEVVLEWKELVSINDLVVTPIGGAAIAEFFNQLGGYLNSRQRRQRTLHEVVGAGAFGRNVASLTLGLPARVRQRLDDPEAPPFVAEDNLGLSSAYAHEFRVGLGHDVLYNDEGSSDSALVIEARGKLAAMPGFLRPGEFETWFTNGNFTSMRVRAAFDQRLRDLDVTFDSHLFGHYGQNVRAARGGRWGLAHEVATRTGLRYVDRWLLGRRDHYAMVHIFGPTGTLWALAGPARLRVSADLSPDFGPVRSLAYERWLPRFGEAGTKSSLRSYGYYHSWGVSSGLEASASVGDFTLSLGGRYGIYESIDGLERAPEPVTREVHASDSILEVSGGIGFAPRRSAFVAGIDAAHFVRRSEMRPFETTRWDTRAGGSVGIRF